MKLCVMSSISEYLARLAPAFREMAEASITNGALVRTRIGVYTEAHDHANTCIVEASYRDDDAWYIDVIVPPAVQRAYAQRRWRMLRPQPIFYGQWCDDGRAAGVALTFVAHDAWYAGADDLLERLSGPSVQ